MGKSNNQFSWNDSVSLKEYFNTRLDDMEKANNLVREIMNALKDQSDKFVTKEEMGSKIEIMQANIKALELSKAHLEGKASQTSVYIAYVFSIIGAILGIIGLFGHP